jgi:hypothetical protein
MARMGRADTGNECSTRQDRDNGRSVVECEGTDEKTSGPMVEYKWKEGRKSNVTSRW